MKRGALSIWLRVTGAWSLSLVCVCVALCYPVWAQEGQLLPSESIFSSQSRSEASLAGVSEGMLREERGHLPLFVVFTPGGQGVFLEEGQPSTRNLEVKIPLLLGMYANVQREQIPEIRADEGWTWIGWQVTQQRRRGRSPDPQLEDTGDREDLLRPWKILYMGYPDPERVYSSEELLRLDFTPIGEKQWRVSAVYREAPQTGANALNLFRGREEDRGAKLEPVVASGEAGSALCAQFRWGWFLIFSGTLGIGFSEILRRGRIAHPTVGKH